VAKTKKFDTQQKLTEKAKMSNKYQCQKRAETGQLQTIKYPKTNMTVILA
jgi:hypothetical protein